MQYETGDMVHKNDDNSVNVTVLIPFIAKDGTESYVGITEDQTVQVVTAAQILPVQDVDDVQFPA